MIKIFAGRLAKKKHKYLLLRCKFLLLHLVSGCAYLFVKSGGKKHVCIKLFVFFSERLVKTYDLLVQKLDVFWSDEVYKAWKTEHPGMKYKDKKLKKYATILYYNRIRIRG
ncbi:hypothetical protein KY315_00760 [Candidatus Woesearchaeota archaeon]|nr:hypothetical protein [Candidatus Woesearchaeota archaeon]